MVNDFCDLFLVKMSLDNQSKSKGNEFDFVKTKLMIVFEDLELEFFKKVNLEYSSKVENILKVDKNALISTYQMALLQFCSTSDSEDLLKSLLEYLLAFLNKELCKIRIKEQPSLPNEDEPDKLSPEDKWKFIISRVKYYHTNIMEVRLYVESILKSNDTYVVTSTDLVTANYLHYINAFLFKAIKEARVDIAMVSLNDMTLEDYMLFCVQCFDDNHFFNTCKTDIEKDEVVSMRLALVMEYFHTKKRNGWCLENNKDSLGEVIGFRLSDDTKKLFENMYLWNYRSKFYKETKPHMRNQNYRELYNKCQKWICHFDKIVSDFCRNFAKFYDDYFERIIYDCDVFRKINDPSTEPQVRDRLSAIRKQFNDVHVEYITGIKNPFDNLSDSLENIQCNSDVDVKYVEDRFSQDLKTVSLFQEQKTLQELHELNEEMKETCKSLYCDNELEEKQSAEVAEMDDQEFNEFHAYSLDEFNFYVNYCIEKFNETVNGIKNKNPDGLQVRNADTVWFRGETNLKYSLNPALMREYNDEKEKKYGNLRRYHHSNYEEFKFRADGASEMPTGVRFTKSDYVALMQHYEIYTNFLDWTETLITSLYFALKYYFKFTDEELEKTENKKYKRDVCLYMFHPGVYNSFRRDVLKELSKKVKELDDPNLSQDYFTSVYSEESEAANLIPNLSTKENENIFDMFILGESSFDKFYLHNKNNINTVLKDNPSLQELFLPIAVWTSRLNSRIRTQSGCFVAFDLYSPQEALSSPGGKPYDSISLMSIQERHKPPKDKNQSNTRVFIYKIVIDKDCCREVVDWLKGIGVTAETVYPELEQLKGRFN